ncbi:S8 family serine peptidase [Spirosoma linguale]|uniref:Peptidase S8 and S53 subtilisin kexin sedolisin n=1 Tax=Spirosoma linguale (strain ATCC 33905 / DSM 74 / LMG 10896 / Claus 1) TaxID=504472 RepID=D2QUF4_SPILD|nr:peptidase S8 and S53 subtilisin kexin sedolisin [Spirosoma linguale DSM 74]
MPARYPIFSTYLTAYRPVMWLAQPVHSRYAQLRDLLRNRLGAASADLLAEPFIPAPADLVRTEARWFSEAFRQGTPLPDLPAAERLRVSQLLDTQLTAARELAHELEQSPQTETQQMGTLLRLAIEVPGPECVLTNGDSIVLVLWGFDSDRSRQERFRVSQYLKHQLPVSTTPNPANPNPPTVPVNALNNEVTTNTDTAIRRSWWSWFSWWPRWGWTSAPVGPAGPVGPTGPGGCGCLLAGLLGLLLLFALLYWFWPTAWPSWLPGHPGSPETGRSISPNLPDRGAGQLPPVDTTQIINDPTDSLKRPVVGNRLNVFLKKEADLVKFADKLKKDYPTDEVHVVAFDTIYKAIQVEFPANQREVWRQRLEKMPEVYVVFDEHLFQASAVPNDPALIDHKKGWYFSAIRAFDAWNITRGLPEVIVAVLDDGFDTHHPELTGQLVQPRNVPAGNNEVNTKSVTGGLHGTHVAGTVAGFANNGEGSSGIAPGCRVMSIQVSDVGGIRSLALVFGIQYAIQHGAQIISLSLGSALPPPVVARLKTMPESEQESWARAYQQTRGYQSEQRLWNQLFGEATRNGIVVVKAAGNDGLPAKFDPMNTTPYTINVSAAALPGANGQIRLATFSNYGSATTLTAPGEQIYNAVAGGGYDFLDGTSMATPIVAGGVALIKSIRPDLSPTQIREVLVQTGIPFVNNVHPVGPMIQLDKALMASRQLPRDACATMTDSLRREIQRLKRQLPVF